MATINGQMYEFLRTYQRELNQREPGTRQTATKESETSFGNVLERVMGSDQTQTSPPVEASSQATKSDGQRRESEMLETLNYDPAGYLVNNNRGRQSIIDFFQ